MKRSNILGATIAALVAGARICFGAETAVTNHPGLTIAEGPFQPTWESLTNYRCPDWFRDAKFGIWAHWGPQCEPEQGDWYARNMYIQGSKDYEYQVAHFGHPSKAGFKEVIHAWKAENFDPDKLLAFYRRNGAKYFMALANHHDNFDNFNSKYQPWNAVNLGPHKDLIGQWAAAARKNGLRFAVSVHAGRSWTWYEVAQGADTNGPLAGVPYDGKLTKADGKGLWWDGLDPQDLYAQNHPIGAKPDQAYCDKFYLRVKQLWDDYNPDMIYFDDSVLPIRQGGEEYGLNLYAHFYNSSIQRHGSNDAVVNAKRLDPMQRQALVYDIERGKASGILPEPWQTDTCIGQWHYNRAVFERHGYKTPAMVIPMLVDIVSKNGNLMLSVPVRADGTIDEDEARTVSGIGAWLKVNGEAIYGTRPWKIYGEGPSTTAVAETNRLGGIRDVGSKPFTAEDIRFTTKGAALYAIVMGWPTNGLVKIPSLGSDSPYWQGKVQSVKLLGSPGRLKWDRDSTGLSVILPKSKPCDIAYALKITGG
jgi:alpha-L-fucosidase